MQEPLISIIVPVYKVENYLDRCIESMVNQTYTNLEIILVDDGSPDNSGKICDKWAKADSRIKVIHKENEGVGIARNTALAAAKGEYIAFVDGDDYCFSRLYEILYSNLINENADISICSYYENDVETDDVPLTNHKPEIKQSADVMPNVCVGDYAFGVLWNKLYKKEVVEGLTMPPLKCSQDLPYNYYAFKRAKKVIICDEQLYFYRNRATSTTKSNFKAGAFDAIKAKEIILRNETDNPKLLPYAIKGYINSNFVVLSGMITNNMFMDRFEELRGNILNYKNDILSSNMYSKFEKIKVITLSLSPWIYKKIIANK